MLARCAVGRCRQEAAFLVNAPDALACGLTSSPYPPTSCITKQWSSVTFPALGRVQCQHVRYRCCCIDVSVLRIRQERLVSLLARWVGFVRRQCNACPPARRAIPVPLQPPSVHVELRIPRARPLLRPNQLAAAATSLPACADKSPQHSAEGVSHVEQLLQFYLVALEHRRLLAMVRVARVQLPQPLETSPERMSQSAFCFRNF